MRADVWSDYSCTASKAGKEEGGSIKLPIRIEGKEILCCEAGIYAWSLAKGAEKGKWFLSYEAGVRPGGRKDGFFKTTDQ